MVLQILISLFVFIIFLEIIHHYQSKNISLISLLFWIFIWLAVLLVVWFPQITGYIASFLHIQRGIDSVVYLAIVVLFYLVFRLLLHIDQLEKKIEVLVREIALHQDHEQKS